MSRRLPHPGRASRPSTTSSTEGADGDGLHPPRPAQGGTRRPVRHGPGPRTAWLSWPPVSSCSRTSASTPGRRPTTRSSSQEAGPWPRRLCERCLRRLPPGATPRWSGPRPCSPARAGLLLLREIGALGGLLGSPAPALRGRGGGAKVADKLGVLRALLERVDAAGRGGRHGLHLPGRRGPRCRRARSSTGTGSRTAPRSSPRAGRSCSRPTSSPSSPVRRSETAAGRGRGTDGRARTCPRGGRASTSGRSRRRGSPRPSAAAGTVLWNGPMGVFEDARFGAGTPGVATGRGRAAPGTPSSAAATVPPRWTSSG